MVSPRSYQRTPPDNRTTARGGCPGFRVMALVRLPKVLWPQWIRGPSLAGYSCGGSRGIAPRSNLSPLREPCACRDDTRYRDTVNSGTGSIRPSGLQLLRMVAQMIGHE